MKNKKEYYSRKKYLFFCGQCHVQQKDLHEFEFVKIQGTNRCSLRCCSCGLLISRRLKFLDEQIKEGKK